MNDERILDAAVVVLDRFGIDGLSARRVAEQAGLSTGAIYGRFENTDELLVEVWNRRLRSVVLGGLERSIRMSDPAVGDPDPVVPESFDPVAERIGAFVIALAPRSDVLSEVVVPDVDAWLRAMGVGPGNPATSRARRAIAIAAYFGAMLNGSVSEALHPDWLLCLRWWEEARAREALPLSGPVAWLPPTRIAVESGNPELDVLLLATGEVMARAGVAGTTVTRIARRAGVPRSAVYAHFDSKDDLVQALGCGTGNHFKEAELRYGRVIIMTDADVDGAHIASLLITFFYRQMPKLIENGHLYLAVPPLYKLSQGAKIAYARNDAHKEELMKSIFSGRGKVEVGRFKGLGEMLPAQLKETTMDPRKRTLLKVAIAPEDRESTADSVERLMGSKPEARFAFIQERAAFAAQADLVDI